MIKQFLQTIRGAIVFSLYTLNVLFWFFPIMLVGGLNFLFPPNSRMAAFLNDCIDKIMQTWIAFNVGVMKIFYPVDIQITGRPIQDKKSWYLVICNHQSWVDILILQYIFHRDMPQFRCFLKKQLYYFPLLGIVWQIVGFVYLKRHSKAEIEKNPSLKLVDLEATKKACAQFKRFPQSIFLFVEGTRFTSEKNRLQQSPYIHLLRPKAAGVALILGELKDKIKKIIDITMAYPEGAKGFWDLICGRIKKIKVDIQTLPVTADLIGDYVNDPLFQQQFQHWLNNLWLEKDARISRMLGNEL